MNGYQATEDVRADIAAALAESGVASLVRAGAPIFIAKGASLRLVHANRAALALFRADSLSELEAGVLAPKSPATRVLAERVRNLAAGVSRIERFDFGRDAGTAKLTFVCRRASTRTRLYVLAGLGLRLREAAAQPVAAPAPAAEEAPEACADLKRSFERRYPGLKPARFLWRTDARNVVTEVTPPLAEIFGGPAVWLVGRDLVAAARDLGLDPERRLATALNSRSTFSGVELMWPIAGADAAAPVSLGALPAFDREKGFDGWRGFGVIQLDRLQQIEPTEPSDPTIHEEAAHDWRSSDFSGVVLPFPPTRGFAAEGREETATLVTLAPHERHAFREIARTLGAQGEADDLPFAPYSDGAFDGAAPAERPAPASEAVAAPESPFDDWPVGLAIKRDRAWLYANRTLLDWLGFADLLEFARSGGLDACGGRETTGAAKILRTRDGRDLAAEVDRAPTVWRGAPAEAVVVRRSRDAQLQARIAALETSLRQRETEAADVMAILQSSTDAVALFNARGDLLGLNAAAEKLFGRNRDDAGTIRDLIAPESQGAFADALAKLSSAAPALAPRLCGQTRFGEALALQASFVRLTDAGKVCVVFRELSHASENEVALREAKARAEAENRAKTEYLAAVTHEIRTPLNAILGFTEVIMDERFGPVGNARYREYIKDIHASGAHVMSLVNDLLDLSKIEAGKLELNFQAVDVNQIVAECVSLIQPQANRERVITRLALAHRLPAALADERSVRQIVLNLLANAVRYNEPGGQVIVSTASANGMTIVRVKDTGIGMNEAELRSALEPFSQLSARTSGGTGLGLPLTKALAEANRADFVIRSRKTEGTLVEVGFPHAPDIQENLADQGNLADQKPRTEHAHEVKSSKDNPRASECASG